MISILKQDITNEQVGTATLRVFGLGGQKLKFRMDHTEVFSKQPTYKHHPKK